MDRIGTLGWPVAASAIVMAIAMVPSLAEAAPTRSLVVVKGLQAPAEILIDHWGVPHIYARSQSDAFFVQGWNAARDRLWQMDLWRRTGLGQLAAVMGPKFAEKDAASRLFQYRGDLKRDWAAYGPQAQSIAESFVAGINAFIGATRRSPDLLPREFVLAGYKPQTWDADDLIRIRSDAINFSAMLQADRAEMACKDGSGVQQALPPVSPPWKQRVAKGVDYCGINQGVLAKYYLGKSHAVDFSSGAVAANSERSRQTRLAENLRNADNGSNNWVISAGKSSTGRPILANDPHLGLELPSVEYVAHISAPGLDAIGAWYPSMPGILVGHNANVAFGGTLLPIAQEDIYVYDINPSNPNEYRYQDHWEAMQTAVETIEVKGGPAQTVTLKFTRHGPVVQDDPAHHRAYSIRATWLEEGNAPFIGALRYLKAKNLDDAAEILKDWRGIGINYVVADTAGKIGWFAAGAVPKRTNTDGILPIAGDGRYEWDGYLAGSLMPREINPARGFIATANQMVLPANYPYSERPIGFYWVDSARSDRIKDVLAASPRLSISDSERLQMDRVTIPGRRLIKMVGALHSPDPELSATIRWFSRWDGRVDPEGPEAALYEIWLSRHLLPAVIDRVTPALPPVSRHFVSKLNVLDVVCLLEQPSAQLGKDPRVSRDQILTSTLASAVNEAKTLLGPDRTKWRWDALAKVEFTHALSPRATSDQERAAMNISAVAPSGDSNTVGVAEYNTDTFKTVGGASFRMVLDVGDWDKSVAVNTPGQSGEWTSPHYRDLFALWHSGRYFPLLFSRAAIEKQAERKILLSPSRD